MQFRQQALAKLQSPESLDLSVHLARPQRWLVLSVTVCAMAVASVWAVAGSVVSSISAPAILTYGQGSYVLQTPVAGLVTAVLAKQGERLPANSPVMEVRRGQSESLVRTIAAGRISLFAVGVGQIVRTGTDIAIVEKIAHASDPLYATVYVPAERAALIPANASVDLTVQSVPVEKYGLLRGHVKSVDHSVESEQQISAFLGDSQLGEQFTEAGRPVAVLVELTGSAATKSGFLWTAAGGPPFALTSMTMATGAIRLADRHPVDWLLP
ncbi:HlyD family efflux transporter periplasmic adaptor subunit [Streptomyces sp. NPDC013172]|uniref:HlyD family efflux transporter periplasmic adaptor subunit n=1 Tax=Streptomyces sp. NPDC013172 TaxID=3155009 RepID=UPI0033FD052F